MQVAVAAFCVSLRMRVQPARPYVHAPAAGMTTNLLSPRPGDESTAGFIRWPFMSVHNWGEDPAGTWFVTIQDVVSTRALCASSVDFSLYNCVVRIHDIRWKQL